jgi:predicted permease
VRGEARDNVLRLGTLAALVAFGIFVLACLNASALVLARLDRRRHALAIRRALGASRWQVVRAGLAEVAVLAALGLALGLFAAVVGERVLNASAFAVTGQVPLRVALSGWVVAWSGLLGGCAVLITGLLPMWHASRVDVASVLGSGATRTIVGGRLVGRRSLIAGQVAAAIALTVITLVAVKGLSDARATDFGFDATTVLQANIDVSVPSLEVDDPHAMFRELRERASALPGVQMAGLADAAPLSGGLARRPIVANGEVITVHAVGAGVGYFETLGIPLLAGSLPADDERDAVAISESLARELRSHGAGLGSVVRIADDGPGAGAVRVVGIVAEVHQAVPGDASLPVMYLRAEHETPDRRSATLLLRTAGRRDVHLEQVRNLVGELWPHVPVWRLQWLSEPVRTWLMPVQALSAVLVVSGGIALLLALSGTYALLAYLVSGRRRELGIRMALGATPSRAYHAVVSGVTFAALVGLAAGAIAGWATSHTLARAFVSVMPADPAVLVLACGLMGTLLAAGLVVPGSAVRRIVPASVLRDE